jgi:hypothetical protein
MVSDHISPAKQKTEEMAHVVLMRWISWIVVFAAGVLVAIFGVYLLQFASTGMSKDPAVWGQLGDFVGGTANPILARVGWAE